MEDVVGERRGRRPEGFQRDRGASDWRDGYLIDGRESIAGGRTKTIAAKLVGWQHCERDRVGRETHKGGADGGRPNMR